MKLNLTLLFLLCSFIGFSQVTAVPIIENRTYQLDGGTFIVFGQSRVTIPIELPENTVEWYYVFSSFSDKEVVKSNNATIGLLSQLSLIIDQTGTTANALSALLAPSGSSNCNVYLFPSYTDSKNFLNKTDQDIFTTATWHYRVQGSIEAGMQGKQRIKDVQDGIYYLGIKAGTSPVIVKIEVVAIVGEPTLESEWSQETVDVITNAIYQLLVEDNVSELKANELANCTVESIKKDYSSTVFFGFTEAVMDKLFEEYYIACVEKSGGTETEEQKKGATYGNLGWQHYENGNLDKAIEYSKKALELNKDMGWVQSNLGLFYFIKGDDLTATDYYIEAILDLKNDQINGKNYLKAAIDDINTAHTKYPEMKGYEAILDELQREYDGF